MPITHQYHEASQLTAFTHAGTVPDDEFLDAYRTAFDDSRVRGSCCLLIDLRTTQSGARSAQALREMGEMMLDVFGSTGNAPKVAVVAPGDLSFGLARMYESFSHRVDWEFSVFRDPRAALEWLGLPADTLPAADNSGKA